MCPSPFFFEGTECFGVRYSEIRSIAIAREHPPVALPRPSKKSIGMSDLADRRRSFVSGWCPWFGWGPHSLPADTASGCERRVTSGDLERLAANLCGRYRPHRSTRCKLREGHLQTRMDGEGIAKVIRKIRLGNSLCGAEDHCFRAVKGDGAAPISGGRDAAVVDAPSGGESASNDPRCG